MNAMPLLTAGKIDRGRLTKIVQGLATEQIALYSLAEFQKEKVMPRTRMQRIIQELWAKSLAIDKMSIGVDDNFFRLGADSVVSHPAYLSKFGQFSKILIGCNETGGSRQREWNHDYGSEHIPESQIIGYGYGCETSQRASVAPA